MDKRPIGIFDSGLGGLTVVKEIKKLLPSESIIYLGDTARVPYGTRSMGTVVRFAFQDAKFLMERGVKCIVIACNTASALAGDKIRKKVPMPVFEVITPAAERVISLGESGRIGVIGTWATIKSGAYQKAIEAGDKKIKVYARACPLLVPFIEEGEIRGKLIAALIRKYLSPLRGKHLDSLILGCTHYPIISKLIEKEIGGVTLVNPGRQVAISIKNFLQEKNMLAPKGAKKLEKYFVTDLTDRFLSVAQMFLSKRLEGEVEEVTLG